MAQDGFRIPTNDVAIGGSKNVEFYTVHTHATAAKMLPGVIVKLSDVANEVMECDASGNAIGFLGYQDTPAEFRPASITTAYAVGDRVAVLRGAGRRQMGYLASGQNLGDAAPVKMTTDGQLTAATVGTDDVVGDLVKAVDASSAAKTCWIVTRK
jgi:hypothetical protein